MADTFSPLDTKVLPSGAVLPFFTVNSLFGGPFQEREGPLPLDTTFHWNGGRGVLVFWGSCYTNVTDDQRGFFVLLDGNLIADCSLYANQLLVHHALPPEFVVIDQFVTHLAAGDHTLEFRARDFYSLTDENDHFGCLIFESQS